VRRAAEAFPVEIGSVGVPQVEKYSVGRLLERWVPGGLGPVLARGASWGFVVKASGGVAILVMNLLLARSLGPQEYGVYAFIFTWAQIGLTFAVVGLDTAAVRYVSLYLATREPALLRGFRRYSLRRVFRLSVVVGLVVAIICLTFTDLGRSRWWLLMVSILCLVPVMTTVRLEASILQGAKRAALSQTPEMLIRPIGVILLAWVSFYILRFDGRADYALAFEVLATGVAVMFLNVLIRRELREELAADEPEYRRREWRETAWHMMFITAFTLILYRADTVMLGMMIGTEASGLYKVASRVAFAVDLPSAAVGTILGPLMSNLYATGSRSQLQRLITIGASAGLLGTAILAGLIFIFNRQLLGLFGPEFVRGTTALAILLAGWILHVIAGPAPLLMNMTGLQRLSAWILGSSVLLNIVLNFVLIPRAGLVGAAVSSLVALVVWNLVSVVVVYRRLGFITPPILSGLSTIRR